MCEYLELIQEFEQTGNLSGTLHEIAVDVRQQLRRDDPAGNSEMWLEYSEFAALARSLDQRKTPVVEKDLDILKRFVVRFGESKAEIERILDQKLKGGLNVYNRNAIVLERMLETRILRIRPPSAHPFDVIARRASDSQIPLFVRRKQVSILPQADRSLMHPGLSKAILHSTVEQVQNICNRKKITLLCGICKEPGPSAFLNSLAHVSAATGIEAVTYREAYPVPEARFYGHRHPIESDHVLFIHDLFVSGIAIREVIEDMQANMPVASATALVMFSYEPAPKIEVPRFGLVEVHTMARYEDYRNVASVSEARCDLTGFKGLKRIFPEHSEGASSLVPANAVQLELSDHSHVPQSSKAPNSGLSDPEAVYIPMGHEALRKSFAEHNQGAPPNPLFGEVDSMGDNDPIRENSTGGLEYRLDTPLWFFRTIGWLMIAFLLVVLALPISAFFGGAYVEIALWICTICWVGILGFVAIGKRYERATDHSF